MNTDSRIVFICTASLLLSSAVAACSASDAELDSDAQSDASTEDASTDDASTDDASTDDASTDDASTDDASTDDASTDDASTDAGTDAACDQPAVAIDALGLNDAISTGAVSTEEIDGVVHWTIDASAGGATDAPRNPWVYVDLPAASAVPITDIEAIASPDWTIALKRSGIRLNSADSGPGGWLLTRIDDASFDELASPPGRDATWLTDDFVTSRCELLTEGRGTPLSAFGIWYNYDPATHAVTPLPDTTWVLYNQVSHAVYKLTIDSWTSGVFQLRVAPL